MLGFSSISRGGGGAGGGTRKRRSSIEVAEELREEEQARAARAVIASAYSEADKKNGKSGLARAGVKVAEAMVKTGDISGAANELTKALGKSWGKKLRTATSARVSRPNRKRRSPEGMEIADLSRPPKER